MSGTGSDDYSDITSGIGINKETYTITNINGSAFLEGVSTDDSTNLIQ
ncbi:hypothetical protein SAMN04488556_4258 [Halostagnicola kamekurae]|uniref:Uncharacterized protein n=1 Tax=Halostagnicola kamekurae TaxID=619731 RepID=A0A1I6V1J7_9EURY|nr:hypothetical protein SAMN04488556_4258 [Halostagnicola kamekurae]